MEIKKIKSFLDPGMKVLPSRVKIKGLGVRFHDLHKIQTPIVETCGFSMKQFDDRIQVNLFSLSYASQSFSFVYGVSYFRKSRSM